MDFVLNRFLSQQCNPTSPNKPINSKMMIVVWAFVKALLFFSPFETDITCVLGGPAFSCCQRKHQQEHFVILCLLTTSFQQTGEYLQVKKKKKEIKIWSRTWNFNLLKTEMLKCLRKNHNRKFNFCSMNTLTAGFMNEIGLWKLAVVSLWLQDLASTWTITLSSFSCYLISSSFWVSEDSGACLSKRQYVMKHSKD